MIMEREIISTFAPKLGVQSDLVIGKAEEFSRIVDVRSGSSSLAALSMSGSCKAVMCLDLAATVCGQPVDRANAVRMSGMNRKLYSGGVKAMERLLDLKQSNTSMPELAVQFGCPSAKLLAIQLLQGYEKQHCGDLAEYSQALFNSAALYTACKRHKVKVDKRKIVDQAGVKRTTFDRLVGQMDKIAQTVTTTEEKTKTINTGKHFLDELYLQENDGRDVMANTVDEADGEAEEEPYAVWKTGILKQAYSALGKQYSAVS